MVFRAILRRTCARGKVVFALSVGLLVLTVSCSNSGFLYVSSSDRNAYFKVPADWKYFDKRDILVASGQSLSAATNSQLPWLIGYDADANPSVQHIVQLLDVPKHPVIEARVEKLPFGVRDQLSLEGLRNWVYGVDQMVQNNAATILSYGDVTLNGGLHGIRMTFEASRLGQGTVSADNEVLWVSQELLIDPATQRLYLFMIRCDAHCYRDNKALLDQIAASWTVKEH